MNCYTGGFFYLGKWAVKDSLVIDFIVHYNSQRQRGNKDPESCTGVDDIWVNWAQVLALLMPDQSNVKKEPQFKAVWTLKGVSYCPILEFFYHAAHKSTSKSTATVFKDILASLICLVLRPNSEDNASTGEILSYAEKDSQMWRSDIVKDSYDEEIKESEEFTEQEPETVQNGDWDEAGVPEFETLDSANEAQNEEFTNGVEDDYLNHKSGEVLLKKKRGRKKTAFSEVCPEERHKTRQMPLLGCRLCDKQCPGSVRLYSHYVNTHPGEQGYHPERPNKTLHPCKLCGELYIRRSHLYKHYLLAHPDQTEHHPTRMDGSELGNVRDKQHQCKGCERAFNSMLWLYKHCEVEHKDQPEVWPAKRPLKGKGLRPSHMHERGEELRCGLPECNFNFSHFQGLVRHERTHTEACICILCGKPCWSNHALIDHCDLEHEDKSKYMCRVCGFFNYSEVMLKTHTVQVHMKGTQEYECDHPGCEYKSSNQSTFQAHVRHHNIASSGSHVCEECGKECATPRALNNHRKSHISEETYPYGCPYCPKRFCQVSLLTIHKRVHTGEKPFKCNECGQMFGSKSTLIKHNLNIHTPEDEMPYRCNECGKTFSKARRAAYLGHLKQHSGIRDHVCPLCSASFSSRGYLSNHFKKAHKRRLPDHEKEMQEAGKGEEVEGGGIKLETRVRERKELPQLQQESHHHVEPIGSFQSMHSLGEMRDLQMKLEHHHQIMTRDLHHHSPTGEITTLARMQEQQNHHLNN